MPVPERQVDGPSPGPPPPPPTGNDGSNKNLLIVIAIFSAVSASVLVIGLGYWGYSSWRANQLIAESITPLSSGPDLTGTWEGSTKYPSGNQATISAVLSASDPIRGSFTFTFEGQDCIVDVSETSRQYGTIYVDTRTTAGSLSECADSGEWQLTSAGNTLTGTLNWSSEPDIEGMSLSMHKN